ncbi:MAG: glycosyltransferase [Myxococcota bacterium]
MTSFEELQRRHEASEARRRWLKERAPRVARLACRGRWVRSSVALALAEARWGRPKAPGPSETPSLSDEFGHSGPRIVIKTPVPEGPQGEAWGDLSLVRGLGRALATRGYRVRIDRWPQRGLVRAGDAATLVLRGRRLPDWSGPRPHLLWCISHPDELELAELEGYAHIFVASLVTAERWGRRLGEGRVGVLLQAFDETRLTGVEVDPRWAHYPVFVGNSRFVRRPVVEDALTAGLPLLVVGRAWQGRIPSSMWHTPGLPNNDALALYGQAGVVLNDHWPDMARHGFLSNRLFDVVARGRPVVTDPVPTMEEVFGDAVLPFTTPSELRARVEANMGVRLPPERVEVFRERHGLQARAEVLAATLAQLGVASEGP